MKLIDADKIVQKTYGVVIEDMFHMHETVEVVSAIDIKKAPSVKAIPVEWIKKWCNKEHNRKSLEERLLKRYGVITMLEDWEKENENIRG